MRGEHKCKDCRFCDAENLTCYPESDDCLGSYELDEEDLVTPARCDFFEPIILSHSEKTGLVVKSDE